MLGGEQARGHFQGDTGVLRPSEGWPQGTVAWEWRTPTRQHPAQFLNQQTCPILYQYSSCGHWSLLWLCDPGHCPLAVHMDSWINSKCYFLWKAALDSFLPSQQLWGSMLATPPRWEEGYPEGPSIEGLEQTGYCGLSLLALLGASPWRSL